MNRQMNGRGAFDPRGRRAQHRSRHRARETDHPARSTTTMRSLDRRTNSVKRASDSRAASCRSSASNSARTFRWRVMSSSVHSDTRPTMIQVSIRFVVARVPATIAMPISAASAGRKPVQRLSIGRARRKQASRLAEACGRDDACEAQDIAVVEQGPMNSKSTSQLPSQMISQAGSGCCSRNQQQYAGFAAGALHLHAQQRRHGHHHGQDERIGEGGGHRDAAAHLARQGGSQKDGPKRNQLGTATMVVASSQTRRRRKVPPARANMKANAAVRMQ